jgi:predicted nucleotidyltransferase component of viral defense system
VVTSEEQLLVDLAVDAAPLGTPLQTPTARTLAPEELAARKVLALFDRAELRDFIDVYTLSSTFDRVQMLSGARALDEGLDLAVFLEMIASLDRFADDDIREFDIDANDLRQFFASWIQDLGDRSSS